MKNFTQLRNKYPTFRFNDYTAVREDNALRITYDFEIPELTSFQSTFTFPLPPKEIDLKEFDTLIFSIGMIEMLSYWKATCSETIEVMPGSLPSEALSFWSELFYLGLGEFRYLNDIDCSKDDFMKLKFHGEEKDMVSPRTQLSGNLIPVGGGKDSIVTLELMKRYKDDNLIFFFNPRTACERSADTAQYDRASQITVNRTLDKRLIDLNNEGFLNGHTPFSALLAFSSLLTAALYDKKYIVLSNEGSASEGNIQGLDINHQYSKSLAFEKLLRDYITDFITSDIEYFSLLRPLNELQITKLFSEYREYHQVFRSCNVGHYTNTWCGKCSKCLFTNLMLTPFLNVSDRMEIFGSNLYENIELHETLSALYKDDLVKPFDCVGTREEVRAALSFAVNSLEKNSPLLKNVDTSLLSDIDVLSDLLSSWHDEHFLPGEYEKILRENIQ